MLPLRSRILAKVISIVRVLNQGHIFHATTNAEHKYGKMKTENEPAMGHSRVLQCGYLLSHPLCYIQLLLKRALIFHIPIHKASEQPWRHVTSLKLCKCSQISHPSPKVALTSCRWHMLRFDTGLEGGKPFLPVSKLLGLTYVICCNQGLFFPNSVMFRDHYFPKRVIQKQSPGGVHLLHVFRTHFLKNTSG